MSDARLNANATSRTRRRSSSTASCAEALAVGMSPLATRHGKIQWREIHGKRYAYFGFRDADSRLRMAYVGPDNDRVRALEKQFSSASVSVAAQETTLRNRAQASIALGCAPMLGKHFRIVQKLGSYGFFRAGGVLIGTHAFVCMGNMLGVKWQAGDKTLDVDFADAGKNISIALPADIDLSVHDALTSLEMGLLPIREFSGKVGAQYRNPEDPELRIDFVTSAAGKSEPIAIASLGLALEPLKFMEFSLEGTTQGAALSDAGACLVNLPDPSRYAVHKLIVSGARPIAEHAKSNKDLEQAAALIQWHLNAQQADRLSEAWNDAMRRGPGWRNRATQGRRQLVAKYPDLERARRPGRALVRVTAAQATCARPPPAESRTSPGRWRARRRQWARDEFGTARAIALKPRPPTSDRPSVRRPIGNVGAATLLGWSWARAAGLLGAEKRKDG